MRAVRIERFGPVTELSVGEGHNVAPRSGEAVVHVKAAAINQSDVKNAQGMMPQTMLPRIPGRDFAGIVTQGPRNYHGMEVWGSSGELGFLHDGTHAQFVAVPVAALKSKPRKLSFEEAAAVGVTGVTANTALKISLLKPEKTVLIVGAAGGVGAMAAQIARWRNSHVIGVVRHPDEIDRAKAYGADNVIMVGKQDMAAVTMEVTHGHGVDVVLNTAGPEMIEPSLACLAIGGRLVLICAKPDQRASFGVMDFYRRDLRILGLNTLNMDSINSTAVLHELATGFDSGVLKPPTVKTIPLDSAVAGYQAVEQGAAVRIVLVPG